MAEFSVSATSKSATELEVTARQFTWTVDEPPMLGGNDAGPNPVEYLLSALVGCLNIVVNVVAKERGIEIRGIKAHAAGDLNPTLFLKGESPDRAGFKAIEVTLEIDTDADAATVADLVAEAERRCPVSDNIANLTPVKIGAGEVPKA